MFRNALLVCATLSLSACGSAYISPDVAAKEDGSVRVVSLTADTITTANKSKYRPKQIPGVFFQNAGGAGSLRGAGALPEPALLQERRPVALETRIPPEVPRGPYEIGVGDVVATIARHYGYAHDDYVSSACAPARSTNLLLAS